MKKAGGSSSLTHKRTYPQDRTSRRDPRMRETPARGRGLGSEDRRRLKVMAVACALSSPPVQFLHVAHWAGALTTGRGKRTSEKRRKVPQAAQKMSCDGSRLGAKTPVASRGKEEDRNELLDRKKVPI